MVNTITVNSAQSLDKMRTVNDFSIQVATVNGSGSQSSNNILMRSIFQMGVPVSGKIFSFEHSWLANVVYYSGKQGWLCRTKERN